MMADDGDPAAANPLERSGNRVAAVVAYFPPTDLSVLLHGRPKGGAIAFDDRLLASVSPIYSVDARDPPTPMLHGDADRGVPPAQSEVMHAALDIVGVENRLTMFADADHHFYVKGDPGKTDAYATQAMNAMVGWFESHLRKSAGGRPSEGRNERGRRGRALSACLSAIRRPFLALNGRASGTRCRARELCAQGRTPGVSIGRPRARLIR